MSDPLTEALESISAPAEAPQTETKGQQISETAGNDAVIPDDSQEAAESAEQAPAPKALTLDDESAFSDEALADPASLARAREFLKQARRDNHKKYLELSSREAKFKKQKQETFQLRENLKAQFGLLQADLQALRTGDASTALAALSRLSGGKSGEALFEEIALNLAANGQKQAQKPSPEVETLKNELSELKRALQERDFNHQNAQVQAQLAQEKAHIVQFAQSREQMPGDPPDQPSGPARFPILAAFCAQNPEGVANDVAQYVLQQYQSGNPLDYPTALSHIETQLGSTLKLVPTQLAARAEPGRETGARARPVAPQVGKTMAPSLATAPGPSARALSEAELLEKAARELPDSWFRENFGLEL